MRKNYGRIMHKLLAPLQRLRWKLTLSYTLVTVAAVLLLELALLLAGFYIFTRSDWFPSIMMNEAQKISQQIRPFFFNLEDPTLLQEWLEMSYPNNPQGSSVLNFELSQEQQRDKQGQVANYMGDLIVVINKLGQAHASNTPEGTPKISPGDLFLDPLSEEASQEVIEIALRGKPASVHDPKLGVLMAVPILEPDGTVAGVLYMRTSSINPSMTGPFIFEFLRLLGVSALFFTFGAGTIGTLFGFLTARSFESRLKAISKASDEWSRGDFTNFIKDPSNDEISELAGRLNRMAEQLQNLLQTRQELATLEERNRLARELHDSVKQQVFASAMQVGAARALLNKSPQEAEVRLAEAERLARQAQQELTSLIRELRPAALEGKGLVLALKEYLLNWSRRTGIQAKLSVQGERTLSLNIEQALYRVTEEALANAARHSSAKQVNIHLSWEGKKLTLTIADNGKGFSVVGAEGKGIGLQSMRERIENVGGNFSIESSPNGTCVRVITQL